MDAECTAMSLATFGPTVDLQSAGRSAFPDHVYEAAQAEAFTGVRPFAWGGCMWAACWSTARRWPSPQEISCTLSVLDRYPPGSLRLRILSRKWTYPWEFEEAALDRSAERAGEPVALRRRGRRSEVAEHEVAVALLDNLDIPRALATAEEVGGQVLRDLVALLGLS